MTKTWLLLISSLISISTFVQAADHAPLDPRHVQTAEKFTQQLLKQSGRFNLEKITTFLGRLEREKLALANDLYETKILEKIDLEIEDHADAIKAAKKENDEEKSKFLKAYNDFLIPQIAALQNCVAQGNPDNQCQSIVDTFIAGYAAFYLPEAPRNVFHHDRDILFNFKNIFGYTYLRNSNRVEANNLITEEENLPVLRSCLPSLQNRQLLTQIQLESLKRCGVDISILNPAEETFWKKPSEKSYEEAKDLHEEWFPRPEERIYFKRVKYSSNGSPKLEGEFQRDGKDIDVKIKFGYETHSEIVTSILGKLVGFYQDNSVPRKTVKVYFKKKMDYSAFKAQWSRKYSGMNRDFATYVLNTGKDEHGSWVLLQDAQLSINSPQFLRLSSYDPAGWDLPNRREQRAQILWFGMMAITDVKTGNHVALLEKTENGLVPRFSLQDVGLSLNYQMDPTDPYRVFQYFGAVGVNSYSDSFLRWDHEKVHIAWADERFNRPRFQTATYADLKWMARQIARVSYEDIQYAVNKAGYPAEIADLYIHKISARRNEIIRAFHLEKEFSFYPVPDLKNYSPNSKVKNGKIVVSQFDGYSSYELPRRTILPVILKAVSSLLTFEALNEQFQAKVSDKIDISIGKEVDFQKIGVGISVDVRRTVEANPQYVSRDGEAQAFVVRDRFSVEINADSSIYKTLKNVFPDKLSTEVKLTAWKREFEMIHFSDTWLDGYKKPVKLLSFITDWRSCLVDCLERGEVLKISDSYGVDAEIESGVGVISGVPMTAGVNFFWQNSKPTYFYKDQLNQLSVYEAKNNTVGWGASIGVDATLNLLVLDLPFLDFAFSSSKTHHQSALYRFATEDNDTLTLKQIRAKKERDLLEEYLDYGDSSPWITSKKDLNIDATANSNKSILSFFFVNKHSQQWGDSQATVKLADRQEKHFIRYSSEDTDLLGSEQTVLLIGKQVAVVQRDSTRISIEMDEEDPKNLAVAIEVWNYDRKLNREGLVRNIEQLNSLYSRSASEPFYQNYFLPPKEEVDVYRKIYGHTRIYIYGDSLINKLISMSKNDLKDIFDRHYKGIRIVCTHGKSATQICPYEQKLNAFIYNVNRIKGLEIKDKTYLRLYQKILKSLDIRKNGLGLVTALVDSNKIFTMGEIYGVYPSFSTMQQDQTVAGRRFAAKSWGSYTIPPLRQFLHSNFLKTDSIYVTGGIDFDSIFGSLPLGNLEYY